MLVRWAARVSPRRAARSLSTGAVRVTLTRSAAIGAGAIGVGSAVAIVQLRPRELPVVIPTVAQMEAAPSAFLDASQLERRSEATIALGSGWTLFWKIAWRCVEIMWCMLPFTAFATLHSVPLVGTYIFPRATMLDILVGCLARCGPVGIKWGQWASTRYDIFEEDFCQAVATLTNHAPCHSIEHTRRAIEDAFGVPMEELFESFEDTALASGSIGQVHIARLRAEGHPDVAARWTGRKVAVKVQHPNLPHRLALDMAILRYLGDLAARVAPDMRIGETADQFASNFEAQLDFNDEAANLRFFGENFGSKFWSSLVTFPRPVGGLVAHDVLVETFEEGESVARFLERKGAREVGEWSKDERGEWVMSKSESDTAETSQDTLLRSNIALCGIQAYLKMLIWDNKIHADLHPGNVLIRLEEINWIQRAQRWIVLGDASALVPHVVFLDAGLAAHFNPHIHANVNGFFDAIVKYDGVRIGETVLGLAPAQPYCADPQQFIDEVAAKCAKQKKIFDSGGGAFVLAPAPCRPSLFASRRSACPRSSSSALTLVE